MKAYPKCNFTESITIFDSNFYQIKYVLLRPQSMLNVIYLSFNVWNHFEIYKITTVYCLSQLGGLLYGLISCCELMLKFSDLLVLGDVA